MKTYNYQYKDYEEFKKYVIDNKLDKKENILIQAFVGVSCREKIQLIIKELKNVLPKSKIIGVTSASEILASESYEQSITLSISEFEKTTIKTVMINEKDSDYEKGKCVGENLINGNIKAIISFVNANVDGTDFLNGVETFSKEISISGGLASGFDTSNRTYVFNEEGISENGAVAAGFYSDDLYIYNDSSFNWIPIGKEHIVTETKNNTIVSIDNIPAIEFYQKYMGIKDVNSIKKIGTKFPFMFKDDDVHVARPIVDVSKDGGLIISVPIRMGEKIRIGYGDLSEILSESNKIYKNISQNPVESLFIYSCIARKEFLGKYNNIEVNPLRIINNSGFYSFGEFTKINNKNMLLTESLTVLAMSEDKDKRIIISDEDKVKCKYIEENQEETVLYNLIRVTGEELNDLNTRLEEKVQQKTNELKVQYYKDQLTNLYNRNKLTLDISEDKYNKLALIDIKSFNDFNDFYGNEVGDSIIIEIARIIDNFCRENKYIVYRINSDVYSIAAGKDVEENEFISHVKILQKIIDEQCYYYKGLKIFLSTTVSVVIDDKKILEKAEMALSYAKKNQSNFQMYDDNLNILKEIENNIIWSEKIKRAMNEDRIVPFFQPIINNQTNKIEKFESLMRMIVEDNKAISPFRFLDIAKKAGLYKQLTRIMIEKTFDAFQDTEYEFSINLLLEDINDKETRDLISDRLDSFSKPEKVVFEIVESEGIERFDDVIEFINQVKKYGAKVAIDDFGTGYSNFSYLLKLNVDYIKIDGSIIKNVNKDKSAEVVTKTIVNFAKELGINTIAEFVADQEIFDKIRGMDVNYSQGYYFSEPVNEIPK